MSNIKQTIADARALLVNADADADIYAGAQAQNEAWVGRNDQAYIRQSKRELKDFADPKLQKQAMQIIAKIEDAFKMQAKTTKESESLRNKIIKIDQQNARALFNAMADKFSDLRTKDYMENR